MLLGKVNPSGRLPITYPSHSGDLNTPYWHAFSSNDTYSPLFAFGHGLSYTTFQYRGLRLSAPTISPDTVVDVTVDLHNVGKRDGKEAVLLYLTPGYRRVSPEARLLKRFAKPFVTAGSSVVVRFTLGASDFEFYERDKATPSLQDGTYTITVGDQRVSLHFVGSPTESAPERRQVTPSLGADHPWTIALVSFAAGCLGTATFGYLRRRQRRQEHAGFGYQAMPTI